MTARFQPGQFKAGPALLILLFLAPLSSCTVTFPQRVIDLDVREAPLESSLGPTADELPAESQESGALAPLAPAIEPNERDVGGQDTPEIFIVLPPPPSALPQNHAPL